jgi:cyclic beta-1,2-glucan synthetase
VYQDLFGEGIFTGKGAYDVAAFRRAIEGRAPENIILSHDLFEGLHGRTALASDIVLYEDFPPDFLGYARRSHRWIRGDWQILPWLGATVPGAEGARLPSRFDLLDRWRIADNLRRSLIAPGLVLLAAVGWLMLPGPAWLWTLLTIAAPGAYLFTDLVTSLARGRRRGTVRGRLRGQLDHAGRWALAITFMLYEAAVAVDAIGRSLWRMYVSRRQLLEWTTAAQVAHAGDASAFGYWRAMWVAPASALLLAVLVLLVHPAALAGAAPLLALWFVSPAIAAWIGRPVALPIGGTGGRRPRVPAPARAAHLVFLRGLRGPRGQLASARQLPGRSPARDRPPDLAHQHRDAPACRC